MSRTRRRGRQRSVPLHVTVAEDRVSERVDEVAVRHPVAMRIDEGIDRLLMAVTGPRHPRDDPVPAGRVVARRRAVRGGYSSTRCGLSPERSRSRASWRSR
jgi:hypothetical protein